MDKYLPNVKQFVVGLDSSLYFDADMKLINQSEFEELLATAISDDGIPIEKISAHDGHFYAHTNVETLRYTGDYSFSDRYTMTVAFWPSTEAYKEAR
jgi:hypothetical protein